MTKELKVTLQFSNVFISRDKHDCTQTINLHHTLQSIKYDAYNKKIKYESYLIQYNYERTSIKHRIAINIVDMILNYILYKIYYSKYKFKKINKYFSLHDIKFKYLTWNIIY